jgi:predicted DNA-binding protein (UPF0251 family)/predicted Fe-Mo cluster-binding NifX family protein
MPRPRKCRRIEGCPKASFFKPQGIPLRELTEVYLTMDGFEAMRLSDYEGLSMEEGAERMHVSRHTFGRILGDARRVVTRALVDGLALHIAHDAQRPCVQLYPDRVAARKKELSMTKIAITSEGPGMTDRVDPRFGRAAGFVVVDLETMESKYIDNGGSQTLSHGAGIQAAENIINAGASVLLTGSVGPKAFAALKGGGVKIGHNMSGGTVADAVEAFKAGKVEFTDSPNR